MKLWSDGIIRLSNLNDFQKFFSTHSLTKLPLFPSFQRIKANQIQKLLREEKEVLQEQINSLNARHQSIEEVVRRLEEREKTLQAAVQSMEKEINLRAQAGEMHKRKALEATQQIAEATFKLESANKQLSEVREAPSG